MSSRLFGCLALALGTVVIAVVLVLAIRILTLETPSPPAPKTRAPYYVVRQGDTLSLIAERTGITMDELERLNPDLDPEALSLGARIRLRASVPPYRAARTRNRRRTGDAVSHALTAARPPPRRYYVVRSGDDMTAISVKTRVPLDRLIALNRGIRPAQLKPGQRIKVRR